MIENGDFIFSVVGKDDNAISAVTRGHRGGRVNHMGIAVQTHHGDFVLEAFNPEVRLTKIEVFSRRSIGHANQPRLMFGRLNPKHRSLIELAIQYGIKQRNIPYDRLYLTNQAALYCSELVVDMFKYANGGQSFFHENPMSFRDTHSGQVHQAWIDYYAYFGMQVPEGEPGSNPGDISLDRRLTIYRVEGPIPGLQSA